jgi:integrase
VKEVAEMLGHANPAITLRRYTRVLESMRAKTDDALDATFRSSAEQDGTTERLAAVRS